MQTTSALYRSILADSNHWFECTVVIGDSGDLITEQGDKILFGGTAIIVARDSPDSGFFEEQLFSVSTSQHMFDDDPALGKAVAAEIEVKMLNPKGELPTMGLLTPYVRVRNDTQVSEWIQQGVFYIDTRYVTHNSNGLDILTLHGFDAMLMTDQYWQDTGHLNWSSGTVLDTAMVSEIARIIDVRVDERTWDIMTDAFRIPPPTNYTLRDVLGYIAGAYAGTFIMTDIGELRLVSIADLPEETSLLIDAAGDYITFGGDRIKLVDTIG